MKVHNASIKLTRDGKPELYFELEPETNLEYDALKSLNFHKEKHHYDPLHEIIIAQPEMFSDTEEKNKGFSGINLWITYQISQEKYHQMEKEREN